MHFAVQQVVRASAQASAERLAQLPPEALTGLNGTEIAAIQNFAVPPDGSSTLPALPPLTGQVSGRVLASDGTTPIATPGVRFRSTNLLFGRTFTTSSPANGTFSFSGVPGSER